jgi:hypothetical protein
VTLTKGPAMVADDMNGERCLHPTVGEAVIRGSGERASVPAAGGAGRVPRMAPPERVPLCPRSRRRFTWSASGHSSNIDPFLCGEAASRCHTPRLSSDDCTVSLSHIGLVGRRDTVKHLHMAPIRFIETPRRVQPGTLRTLFPAGQIIACDFHVQGIEQLGQPVPGGFQLDRILNIDHHAPCTSMYRRVSSANLALERAGQGLLPAAGDAAVVINHADCDSILTAGIVSGVLEPEQSVGEAAIAADHTGEENDVADLLQGLDAAQARDGIRHDPDLSFRNLHLLLTAGKVEAYAQEAWDARRRKREEAAHSVGSGAFSIAGPVALGVFKQPIDGELFPALIPTAALIVLANPLPADPRRWQIKVRLGLAAPEEMTLWDLDIPSLDPAFGGRWNAGSNRDLGGTELPPDVYAEEIHSRLQYYQDGNSDDKGGSG